MAKLFHKFYVEATDARWKPSFVSARSYHFKQQAGTGPYVPMYTNDGFLFRHLDWTSYVVETIQPDPEHGKLFS